jgi:hypothetical protein
MVESTWETTMHIRTKELVLRKYDDTGADTFQKHWAQIEYTAYWCVHLLIPQSGIMGVIPEGIDDVTLVRNTNFELHQVKCRDESQVAWTTAEVLPILCNQYHRRNAFTKPCKFHFVSDHVADTKTQVRPGISYGKLYRLKFLLDLKHEGQIITPKETGELGELEAEILPRIVQLMMSGGESIDYATARELLYNTWIDTKSIYIRNRPIYDELSKAFLEALPGQPLCNIAQLDDIYSRLLLLVVEKIITGKSLDERMITRDDVLACRTEAITPEANLPNLNKLPGNTVSEKKAAYGGFDITEFPVLALQMRRAQDKRRRLEALGFYENLEDLTLALITLQSQHRRVLSQSHSEITIGPSILSAIQPHLQENINTYFPNTADIDLPFCHGLLWASTNECHLWWHRIGT